MAESDPMPDDWRDQVLLGLLSTQATFAGAMLALMKQMGASPEMLTATVDHMRQGVEDLDILDRVKSLFHRQVSSASAGIAET